nr:MAG TPA: hypothetical protein [Caudoviricetes sp.]
MMDAVKFLKERARMCEANQTGEMTCENCAAYKGVSQCYKLGEPKDPEKMVAIVEQWAAEHPVKTRQSEFLKHYPGAQITIDGFLHACPMEVFSDTGINCAAQTCSECRKAFWLAEDEEGELPF